MANDYRFIDPSRDQLITDAATGTVVGVRTLTGGSSAVPMIPLQQTGGTLTGVLYVTLNNASLAALTQPTLQATNSVNNYTQVSIQNQLAAANSSADMIAYPDNVDASDLTGFMDMGITSSVFAQAAYAVTGANEGYLFSSAPTASGKTGSMVIATDATGTRNDIRFYTNGFNSTGNLRVKIKKEGQVNFAPLAADPATPEEGDVYFNSVSHKLKLYNGTGWETVTSA